MSSTLKLLCFAWLSTDVSVGGRWELNMFVVKNQVVTLMWRVFQEKAVLLKL